MTVFAHSQTTNKPVNEAANDSAPVSGYHPFSEHIRLQDLEDSARSQAWKRKIIIKKTFLFCIFKAKMRVLSHNLSRATGVILDLAAAGSIKNNFLFCRCFWRGVRSNAPRPKFLAFLLRQRKSIVFFSECWKCPMPLLDFESCLVSFDWPFLTRSINTNNSFQYRPVMQANSHEHAPRILFPFPFKRPPRRVPAVLKRWLV